MRRGRGNRRRIDRDPPGGILPPMDEFTHRDVERFGRRILRVGLSGSFDLDEAGCREALERVQYVFWSPWMKALTPALRDALARDRDRYVVSAGPLLGYFPGAVRRAAE